MKKIFILSWLIFSFLFSIKAQTVVIMTNNPVIVNITNVFPVTIINADNSVKYITSNIIDFSQGTHLGCTLIGNTTFMIMKFPTNTFQGMFYYDNPGRFNITFQSIPPITWMNGPVTNNAMGCILFETVFNQLRATQ